MAKEQALRWPIAGRLIRWAGGFPVQKGSGRSEAALEVARAVVESGDGLVMFMEGRVWRDDDGLGPPKSGLARLALATGAPVVPVGIWGAKRPSAYGRRGFAWFPRRVTCVWGAPISFPVEAEPSRERVEQVRDEIWSHVERLYAEARQHAGA
jgi:1-acyl-sn-glycerol-3-phosphate acyltransferase